MSNELDEYSVKNRIAAELIAIRKSRGDKIFFVTNRIFTGRERLIETLKRPSTFRISKEAAFRKIAAVIDIRGSIQAGARPIRVLRARTSVNQDPMHNGTFGEEVPVN